MKFNKIKEISKKYKTKHQDKFHKYEKPKPNNNILKEISIKITQTLWPYNILPHKKAWHDGTTWQLANKNKV